MATEATTPDDFPVDAAPPAVGMPPHASDAFPLARPRGRARPRLQLKRIALGMLVFMRDWGALPLCMLLGLGAALTYVQHSGYIMPIFDDSFISLNFARNLAEHGKMSFDGEHWSTGATSPLHVALLAAVLKTGAAPIFASVAFGVGMHMLLDGLDLAVRAVRVPQPPHRAHRRRSDGFHAAGPARHGQRHGDGPVPLAGGAELRLLLLPPHALRPDAHRLLPGAGRAHAARRALPRPGRAGVPLDYAAAWSPPAAVDQGRLSLSARCRQSRRYALAGYSYAVTGALSGTATVKLQFFREFALPLETRISLGGDQMGLFYGPMWSMVGLAIVGASNRREALLVGLFWLPIVVIYLLLFPGSMYHYFFRYQHPILPFIAVFAAGGAYRLLVAAAMGNVATKALVAASLIIVIVPVTQQYIHWRDNTTEAVIETRNDLAAMSKELDTLILPEQTLATHDIGAVGYFGHFKVLDVVGLVNPDAVDYHARRQTKALIEKERPDFLLIFPDWDRHYLMIDPWYHPEKYQWIGTYPGGELRKTPYFLYRIVYPHLYGRPRADRPSRTTRADRPRRATSSRWRATDLNSLTSASTDEAIEDSPTQHG